MKSNDNRFEAIKARMMRKLEKLEQAKSTKKSEKHYAGDAAVSCRCGNIDDLFDSDFQMG